MTNIELVDAEDVKSGRGGGVGRPSTGKYPKYKQELEPHIQWFKDEIAKSKDGIIRVKNSDILKIVNNVRGSVGKHPTSVYWATKYTLFQEGMWVTQGKHKNGDPILVIRLATEDDVLPASLAKGLAAGTETGSGEGSEEKIEIESEAIA